MSSAQHTASARPPTGVEESLLAKLRRQLASAEVASGKAAEARASLHAGSTRARVTTANSRWARKAEERDRCLRALCDFEDLLRESGVDVPADQVITKASGR